MSISAAKVDVAEVEAKLKVQLDQQNWQLQHLVNGLSAENLDLRSRLARVEMNILKLKEAIEKLLET